VPPRLGQTQTRPPAFPWAPRLPPPKIHHNAFNHCARPTTADGRRHTAPPARKRDRGDEGGRHRARSPPTTHRARGERHDAPRRDGGGGRRDPAKGSRCAPWTAQCAGRGANGGAAPRRRRRRRARGKGCRPRRAAWGGGLCARGRGSRGCRFGGRGHARGTVRQRLAHWKKKGRRAGWVGGRYTCGTRRVPAPTSKCAGGLHAAILQTRPPAGAPCGPAGAWNGRRHGARRTGGAGGRPTAFRY